MKKHIKGAKNVFGRCLLEKAEKTAQLNEKEVFTILGEHIAYAIGMLLPNFRTHLTLVTPIIYMQSMHIFHVHEDDSYVTKG